MMPASFLARGALRRVCRAVAVSLAALALVTCTDNPVEPGRGGVAYVRLQPVFDIFSRVAPLTLDRVRVVVVRPATDTLADVSQSFSPTSTSVRLDIPVRLEQNSEDLEVNLMLYAGSILLFSGVDTARIAAGTSNPVSQIPVTYQGPGSNIASISLAPRDTTVFFGAAFDMQASAVDSQQAPVAQFYVGWSATGGTIDASGRFTAPSVRDTVWVRAVTPTGIVDSTRVFIVASPAALVKVSGDAQSGSIGARLAQPLVVRVDGNDGQPVPGVLVSFAAVTGGGSVDSATYLSDAQGLARMGATLGTTVGAQTFTASAPGLTPVTFSMTGASGGVRTWTGAVSTDWSTAGNWSPAALPAAGDSVVIPTFIPNAPSLAGTTTVGALVIRGTGSNLTVAGSLTVQRGLSIPDTNAFLDMASGALAAGSLTLSGFQAFVDAPTAPVTVAGATIINGNRAFVSARAAGNSFGPVTISGGQPFFEHGGGTSGPVSVTGSGFWEAYGPVTVTGNPAFNVTGDASISTFGGANALITVNGDVLLGGTDGRLVPGPTLGGWTINGNLQLTAQGRLVMTQNADTVRVNGNASFGGADETGSLTAGALLVSGNFTQTGVATSFAATGTAVTLNGSGAQAVSFASPGFATSRFSTLLVENSAGQVQFASDVHVSSLFGRSGTNPAVLSGNGGTLFLTNLILYNWTFNNVLVNVSRTTGFVAIPALSNVAFLGYAPTATPLTIADPGVSPSVQFTNVSFGVTPTTGFFLDATDTSPTDGVRLVIDMVNPSPLSNSGRVQLSGATLNWPVTTPGTWTGAVNTAWSNGGNWSNGQVPTATDNVTIPGGAPRYPVLTANAVSRDLTVATGATLDLGAFTLTAGGSVNAPGVVTAGAGQLLMTGSGTSVAGIIQNLGIAIGSPLNDLFVSGPLTVAGTLAIQGGRLQVGGTVVTAGTLVTSGTGILAMTNAAGQVFVNGTATFGGEDPTNVMSAGELRVRGNLSQTVGVTLGSLVASGTHRVILDGTGPQTVSFASPGTGGSRMNDFEIAKASGAVTFATAVAVTGQFVEALRTTVTVSGGGVTLTTGGISVDGVTFDNVLVNLGAGTLGQFDNVTFTNYASTAIPFGITRPTGTFTFTGLSFSVPPTGGGAYIRAEDTAPTDGLVLTLNLINPTPATSTLVQLVGNAVINWPATGNVFTWDGSADRNWSNPANWDRNAVPGVIDDVILGPITNQPVMSASGGINNLTIQAGAILDVDTTVLVVGGTLDNAGVINGVAGTGGMVLTGTGRTMNGTVNVDVVIPGSYSLNGSFSALSVSVAGASGSLDLNFNQLTTTADFSTLNSGTVTMDDPADQLVVGGSAIFAGGDETNKLTAGTLNVAGDFSQLNLTTANSFVASGTHITNLTGLIPTVSFTDPASSHFWDLWWDGIGGTMTLGTDVRVLSHYSSPDGLATMAGNGNSFTTGSIFSGGLNLDNLPLVIDQPVAGSIGLSGITFTNMAKTATQITIRYPGQANGVFFSGIVFDPLSSGDTGFYIDATDTDGISPDVLTINVDHDPDPAGGQTAGAFHTKTDGVAVVNWSP